MRRIYGSTIGLVTLFLVLLAAGSAMGSGLHPQQQSNLASVSAQAPVGQDAPDATRKLPPAPGNTKPVAPNSSYSPQACLAPVVNVSATTGNQSESFIVVNPLNTQNLVAFSNVVSGNDIFRAYT